MTTARLLRQLLYSVLLVVLLRGCTPLLGASWLSIDVSPRVQHAPLGAGSSVVISVTIPKDPQNRVLCFGYDGTQFRSSCQAHVALEAPLRVQTSFRDLPAGQYTAFAELTRKGEDGKERRQVVTTDFVICGDGGCGGVFEE